MAVFESRTAQLSRSLLSLPRTYNQRSATSIPHTVPASAVLHPAAGPAPVTSIVNNNLNYAPAVTSSKYLRAMSIKSPSQTPKPGGDAKNAHFDDRYLDYDGDLDHAPATSHGTYLDGMNDGLEPLEEYRQGGYHPIHLGDVLGASGRYRVIHKLGYGGFGTVWLCKDTQEAGYVAVKVTAADVTPETLQDLTLAKLDRSAPGAEYVAIPLDSLSVDGPNGTHQCIALLVLGLCVLPRLWFRITNDLGFSLWGMARQATQALNFLHKNGLCHGDFRPSNILVKLNKLDELPEEELLLLLGHPEKAYVRSESGDDLPLSSPQYLTHSADVSRLGDEYLTDQICVIDFGEAYPISSPPADLGIPENYLPPEMLLDEENAIGLACDIWALGCTLFEIRLQIPLFYMIYDPDELLAEMVRFFGRLPEGWWDKWEARSEFFDEQGIWLRNKEEEWTLEVLLSKPVKVFKPGGSEDHPEGTKKALITSETEQKLIADLLYKLLRYDPEQRLSAEEALAHRWFKT